MIKAVIFDCFGVLLADVYRTRINDYVQTHPETDKSLHDILRAVDRKMITYDEAVQHMGEIMGVSPQELMEASVKGEVKNEALITFIKTLSPSYKLALLSNVRGRDSLEERFAPGELDELFDTVIASGDVGFIKPEPQIYQIAAGRLGVSPDECVMIDDVESYCEGARATGMQAIQFLNAEQCKADLAALIDTKETTY